MAKLARELADARRAAGLSIREVARRVGVSPDTILRLERGEDGAFAIDLVARVGEVLGLQLAASLHPHGDPVRDRGQLALIDRLRKRLGSDARLRTEVPIPITGDLRSGDAVLTVKAADGPADLLIEAETHLDDIQLVERKSAAKQRDLGAGRLILLVADTRRNREVIARLPELRQRFPISQRRGLAALVKGEDPGGDCVILL
ncbi:MAG TPA: helix-turn-helix transcriptional regulator [Candidatus Limnocylindrales bacterium]|nr:helix-turn-helix transcriptional regulator [Candidatus Limnocylindrales bacterium]